MKNQQNILFKQIFGRDLNKQITMLEALDRLEELGLIDYGELGEQATSIATGVDRCDRNHPEIDLVNGAQIKTGTAAEQKRTDKKIAYISIRKHTDTIYGIVREKKTKKDYFFVLPYSAYKYQNANTIGIPFENDGRPYLDNKWWMYSVSFDQYTEAVQNHA
jgi:hypothetical protein